MRVFSALLQATSRGEVLKRAIPILLFLSVACSGVKPEIDQAKFEKLYRTAKAIDAATTVGITYAKLGELLQNFATEVSIAKDLSTMQSEISMVGTYEEALGIYRDSAQLWKASLDSTIDDAIPYYSVGWIGDKYGLQPIEYYRIANVMVIPKDTFRLLWSLGSEKVNQANSVYSGKPQPSEGRDGLNALRKSLYLSLETLLSDRIEREKKAAEAANTRAAARAAEVAVLRLEAEKLAQNQLPQVRQIFLREFVELRPESLVWTMKGDPYYHFSLKCPTIQHCLPDCLLDYHLVKFGGARKDLQRRIVKITCM